MHKEAPFWVHAQRGTVLGALNVYKRRTKKKHIMVFEPCLGGWIDAQNMYLFTMSWDGKEWRKEIEEYGTNFGWKILSLPKKMADFQINSNVRQ
jgi:hypothetical protein